MRYTTFMLTAFAASVSAQSASQIAACDALAAQIPACALPCDDAGFKAVNCASTDYACHCANGAKLSTIIPGCLKNSTCTTTDLATFGAIPAKICAILANSTTSANSSTTTTSTKGSGSATATPSGPTASGSATTAGTGASATASGSAAVVNVASTLLTVAGMGVLGFFL